MSRSGYELFLLNVLLNPQVSLGAQMKHEQAQINLTNQVDTDQYTRPQDPRHSLFCQQSSVSSPPPASIDGHQYCPPPSASQTFRTSSPRPGSVPAPRVCPGVVPGSGPGSARSTPLKSLLKKASFDVEEGDQSGTNNNFRKFSGYQMYLLQIES